MNHDGHAGRLDDLIARVTPCFARRETRLTCHRMVNGLLSEQARRTRALHRARVSGRHAAVGAGTARADFHQLPLRDRACDLAVAAFCRYHSRSPDRAIAEITRCLAPGATATIAVKSDDSYRELDLLMADSGLDPDGADRPSLYATAHSGNIEHLTAANLDIREVIHDTHAFTFPAFADLAEYLATSPKYGLPASLTGDAARLAAKLARRLPDEPFTMTSVVTYVVAQRTTATG